MRGALAVIVLGACAHAPVHPTAPAVCGAAPGAGEAAESMLPDAGELLDSPQIAGAKVVRVSVRGPAALADAPMGDAILTKVGDTFDRTAIGEDVRRLWRLGVAEDVIVHATREGAGVAIVFEVVPAPLVGRVAIELPSGDDDDGARAAHVRAMAGAIYDPMRVHRAGHRLEEELKTAGHMKAKVAVTARRAGPGMVDVCVAAAPGPRYVIDRIEFPGARRISAASLVALVRRKEGDVDAPGGAYRAELLDEDLPKIDAAYYDAGMVSVKVGEPEVVIDEHRARLVVKIPIQEGDVYRIGAIEWKGVAPGDVDEYRRELGVERGAVFARDKLAAGIDKLRSLERDRGHQGDVTPLTSIDSDKHTIDLTIEVTP